MLDFRRVVLKLPKGKTWKNNAKLPGWGLLIWKKTHIASGSLPKESLIWRLTFFLHVLNTLQMCSMQSLLVIIHQYLKSGALGCHIPYYINHHFTWRYLKSKAGNDMSIDLWIDPRCLYSSGEGANLSSTQLLFPPRSSHFQTSKYLKETVSQLTSTWGRFGTSGHPRFLLKEMAIANNRYVTMLSDDPMLTLIFWKNCHINQFHPEGRSYTANSTRKKPFQGPFII